MTPLFFEEKGQKTLEEEDRPRLTACRRRPAGSLTGMEKIFALLNQMEADGVIGRYAIGGAV